MSCRLVALVIVALVAGCGNRSSPAPPAGPSPPGGPSVAPIRLLVLTATTGFRHTDGIAAARQVLPQMAAATGEFTVTATEDLNDFAARLSTSDVVFFALTTGELPFTDAQKAAIVRFVEDGGGLMGAHSATDTLYDWPDYGRLIGAYFKEHPWTQEATVTVEGGSHPATRDLGSSFRLMEEFYTFRDNPRSRVNVLLALNAASVGAQGDYPLAWTQSIGQGRTFYTALGHFASTWTDSRFQAHLRGALKWTAKRE